MKRVILLFLIFAVSKTILPPIGCEYVSYENVPPLNMFKYSSISTFNININTPLLLSQNAKFSDAIKDDKGEIQLVIRNAFSENSTWTLQYKSRTFDFNGPESIVLIDGLTTKTMTTFTIKNLANFVPFENFAVFIYYTNAGSNFEFACPMKTTAPPIRVINTTYYPVPALGFGCSEISLSINADMIDRKSYIGYTSPKTDVDDLVDSTAYYMLDPADQSSFWVSLNRNPYFYSPNIHPVTKDIIFFTRAGVFTDFVGVREYTLAFCNYRSPPIEEKGFLELVFGNFGTNSIYSKAKLRVQSEQPALAYNRGYINMNPNMGSFGCKIRTYMKYVPNKSYYLLLTLDPKYSELLETEIQFKYSTDPALKPITATRNPNSSFNISSPFPPGSINIRNGLEIEFLNPGSAVLDQTVMKVQLVLASAHINLVYPIDCTIFPKGGRATSAARRLLSRNLLSSGSPNAGKEHQKIEITETKSSLNGTLMIVDLEIKTNDNGSDDIDLEIELPVKELPVKELKVESVMLDSKQALACLQNPSLGPYSNRWLVKVPKLNRKGNTLSLKLTLNSEEDEIDCTKTIKVRILAQSKPFDNDFNQDSANPEQVATSGIINFGIKNCASIKKSTKECLSSTKRRLLFGASFNHKSDHSFTH